MIEYYVALSLGFARVLYRLRPAHCFSDHSRRHEMSQYRDDYNYDREAPAPRRAPADRSRSSGGRSTGGNVRGGSGSSRGGSGGGRRPSAPKRRSGGGFAMPRGMGIAAAAMAALLVIAFLFKAACENLGIRLIQYNRQHDRGQSDTHNRGYVVQFVGARGRGRRLSRLD